MSRGAQIPESLAVGTAAGESRFVDAMKAENRVLSQQSLSNAVQSPSFEASILKTIILR